MKKIFLFFLLLFSFFIVKADTHQEFLFSLDDIDRNKSIASNINDTVDNQYKINYQKQKENSEQKEIERLTRKVVYLFAGNENTEFTVENYMYRKQALQEMCYEPDIPEDEDGNLDMDSEEFSDNFAVAYFVGGLFKNIARNTPTYKRIGQPIVTKMGETYLSTIAIKDFEYDDYEEENPMEIVRSTTDIIFYFQFKKLDGVWKLSYANAHNSEDTDQYFEEYAEQDNSTSYKIETDLSDVKDLFDLTKLNQVSDAKWNSLYKQNMKNSVILNANYLGNITHTANGFYLRKGIVVTTWSFIQSALQDSQFIAILDANGKTHILDGLVYINEDIDLAVLKLKDESGQNCSLASYEKLKKEDPVFTISSKLGYNLKLSKGIYISNENENIKTLLTLTLNDQGSALYNLNGEIIGLNTTKSIQNNFGIAISAKLLMDLQKQLTASDFKKIKTISFDHLKEMYYYNGNNSEIVKKNIKEKVWNQYKKIGDLENTITLELVKSSYKNKTISLRYKNKISNFMSSMSLSKNFRDKLKEQNYKEVLASTTKYIYENEEYKVILMDNFDYLIIVITEN